MSKNIDEFDSISSVFFSAGAVADMEAHTNEGGDVEVGGLLLGKPVIIKDQLSVIAYYAQPAKSAISSYIHIVMTSESQMPILDMLDQKRKHDKDLMIVGWYHSHPFDCWGSIFLSGDDMFIVNNYFNRPYHISVVLNPKNGNRGVFGLKEKNILRMKENSHIIDDKYFNEKFEKQVIEK